MTTAKFSDILDGYEFCAFGDLMETQAFVSLERGTVHIVSGDMELDEESPDDIDDGPYLALPDKSELGLGRDLVIEFIEEHLPEDVHTVVGFFRKRGAYSCRLGSTMRNRPGSPACVSGASIMTLSCCKSS
jgi:hypothetical protein